MSDQIDLEEVIRQKTITETYKQWMDGFYLVTDNSQGRSTGNGILYTGEALIAIKDIELRSEILKTLYECLTPTGIKRIPSGWWTEQHQAPDDYWGWGLAADELDPQLAREILTRGRKQWWMLNERGDGWRWKSYMGRMPHLIAHLQMAAGETPNLFRMVIWALALLFTLTKNRHSQDSFVKAWMACKVAEGRNKYLDSFITMYRWLFAKKWPGGIGQIRYEYGGTTKLWGKEHPTVKYQWGDL